MDYVSFHLYGATTRLIDGPDEYDATGAQSQYFEHQVQSYCGEIELSDGAYDFPPHSITLLSFYLSS